MLSSRRARPPALLMLLVLALLGGCGQKGPLFIPPPEPEPAGAGEQGEEESPQAAAGG